MQCVPGDFGYATCVMARSAVALIAILAASAAIGGGCGASTSPKTDRWDNRAGPEWKAFVHGYMVGSKQGCTIPFKQLHGYYGSLEPDPLEDISYSTADCREIAPEATQWADIPDAPPHDLYATGIRFGRVDGCKNVFVELPTNGRGTLFKGGSEIDASVCPWA